MGVFLMAYNVRLYYINHNYGGYAALWWEV